ncbi:MAG: NADH-quinone oxidoreductase subunit G, partial [Actinobacteria bacterium]|nr:NADH-quinone oxidoreductase subunit G [Actinomycetota bacterium]
MTATQGPTVTLTIDDREVTVPKGTLVIRAAERVGIVVPRFCDHPLLEPAGACRQCIVEVEGQRKPMTSCTTECTDGMVVRTHLTSDMARDAQKAQLEFLLINHPLDCPTCDKGGECPLQDQALEYGPGQSRFIDEKRRYDKPVAVSPNVLLDRERCVLCARCTRFADQISGDPFIEMFERGALQQVAIYEDEPYTSYFSGNVIQICPVGALTSASYRFRARPFDLRSAPSVCGHCSAGCNLNVHSRRGVVLRQLARTNMDVNEAWNCDKGRFGFTHLTHAQRVREPLVREDGELVATDWTTALGRAADALRAAGTGRVGIISGGRLADDDAYALSKFARTVVGADDVDARTHVAGPDEGDALAAVLARPGPTYADVETAPVVLVVGLDTEEEVPILHLRLRKAWLRRGARIVPLGPRTGSLERYAWRRLLTQPGGEAAVLETLAAALGSGDGASSEVREVATALRDGGAAAVVLVGERAAAGPGVLANAGRLAEALGAKVGWVPRRANARGAIDAGLAPGALPGGRRLDDDGDRAVVEQVWGALPRARGRATHEILRAAARGEIDVLYLVGVDVVRDTHPRLAEQALTRTPVVIAQDLLMTDTVARAHVVLPALATQERNGTYTDWEGRSQAFARAIDGPSLAQEDGEILVQLAG